MRVFHAFPRLAETAQNGVMRRHSRGRERRPGWQGGSDRSAETGPRHNAQKKQGVGL